MTTVKLNNISLAVWRRYLKFVGCNYHRIKGGHEMWGKKELTREIVFQTHIDPIPEFILRNCLKTLGKSRADFTDWYVNNDN